MRKLGLILVCCAGVALPAGALADNSAVDEDVPPGTSQVSSKPAFTIGSLPVWYFIGGLTSGASVVADDRGGFVGGELSLVRLRDRKWFGFYADGYYDFGVDGTYLTAGPEFGRGVFGLDLGGVVRFANGESEIGGTARAVVSFGLFSIYGRYIYMNSDFDEQVVQVGALLKFPLSSPFGGGVPR